MGCGWVVLKANLVFIFGPNLKTKTLLQPRSKLNNYIFIFTFAQSNLFKGVFWSKNTNKSSNCEIINVRAALSIKCLTSGLKLVFNQQLMALAASFLTASNFYF